ncbi:MAG: hypothetical protein ACOX6X_06955 [Dethiobacteria bacterium]
MEPKWEETWEEFCSSDEDIAELKELASLLSKMEPVQASPSFQEELKKRLFEQEKADPALKKNLRIGRWARPLFATAAALILVVSLTFFYGDARPGQPGQQDPLFTAREDFASKSMKSGEVLVEEPSGGEKNREKTNEVVVESGSGVEEPTPGQEPGTLDAHGDDPHQDSNPPPIKEETGPVSEQEVESPLPRTQDNLVEEEETIKEEPQFEIWGKQVQLAADIKLPDYYYDAVAGEKDLAPADVKYAWRPGGKFSIAVNGEEKPGLEPKISKKLSEKGFQVEGAYLKINSIQETQKGVFAEVFFKPRKSSADDPHLVVYYEEDKDIISFYCEEKGKPAGTAYYRLLSPAQAFERTKDAKIYASTELLNFSFQVVNLTYYDFPLGDGRQEKLVKLPAYCYTGMETGPEGKEFKLYLPAVAR